MEDSRIATLQRTSLSAQMKDRMHEAPTFTKNSRGRQKNCATRVQSSCGTVPSQKDVLFGWKRRLEQANQDLPRGGGGPAKTAWTSRNPMPQTLTETKHNQGAPTMPSLKPPENSPCHPPLEPPRPPHRTAEGRCPQPSQDRCACYTPRWAMPRCRVHAFTTGV